MDLAVDREGNIYIADDTNNRLRKLTLSTGLITTVAGTTVAGYNGDDIDATTATLFTPEGVGIDAVGNIYIADTLNHRLRKVTVSTGKITTIAGTGSSLGTPVDGILATKSSLARPASVAVDTEGNVYIADSANHRIRKVSGSTGIITTVAGTGTRGYNRDGIDATTASLSAPLAVAVDAAGNIYIADTYNNRLRKVTLSTGIITTIAGTGNSGFNGDRIAATTSTLSNPKGVAIDRSGNVFIADSENYRIRKVIVSTGIITTIAGTGLAGFTGDGVNATNARLNYVTGIAVDAVNNFYIADTFNHRVRSMTGERRTAVPSAAPSMKSTPSPSAAPNVVSTASPSAAPIVESTASPSAAPIVESTACPRAAPIVESTACPSAAPIVVPTACPSAAPIVVPTFLPALKQYLLDQLAGMHRLRRHEPPRVVDPRADPHVTPIVNPRVNPPPSLKVKNTARYPQQLPSRLMVRSVPSSLLPPSRHEEFSVLLEGRRCIPRSTINTITYLPSNLPAGGHICSHLRHFSHASASPGIVEVLRAVSVI